MIKKGTTLAKVQNCDQNTCNLALEACCNSLKSWRELTIIERGRIIYKSLFQTINFSINYFKT